VYHTCGCQVDPPDFNRSLRELARSSAEKLEVALARWGTQVDGEHLQQGFPIFYPPRELGERRAHLYA
jgi:hypothetical protein